jgi:Holliday junction resolvasome RuvABC endonuclease subunit
MQKIQKILCFDPGLNLGYCVSTRDRKIKASGSIKNNSHLPMGQRQVAIQSFIFDLIRTEKPDLIVVEAINRVGKGRRLQDEKNASTWALYWIYGEINRLSNLYNEQDPFPINPMTLKACVTQGKRTPGATGPAKKHEVMRVIKEMFGNWRMHSDESDAIALAVTFWRIYCGEYVVKKSKPRKKRK